MTRSGHDRIVPLLTANQRSQITRRSFMRTIGLGAAAAVAGTGMLGQLPSVFAQGEQGVGARASGGPVLDDVAFDLEFDTDKIFRFVADEVTYQAYPGALRGAKGTHWSLAGNAVDQALLLAGLLTAALVPVRFAAGELTDDAAAKLLASLSIDQAEARARSERVASSGQADIGNLSGITPDQLSALQSPEALRASLLEFAGAQLNDGVTAIQDALTAAAITLPTIDLALPTRELTQHVWVQYSSGTEWIDLDPSIPGAAAGEFYAKQTETWETIPDEIYHRVRFRAVVEVNRGGEAVREDVLVHESLAANLVGVPVVFAHVDPSAFKAIGVAINGVIDGSVQYVPTLLAGDEGETGSAIVLGASGGILDDFGTSETDGAAIAEWLEIDVMPTDGTERRISREIFDRIGAGRRAAGNVDLATLPPVELTEDPKLGSVFLPLESVRLIGVFGGQIPGAYFDQDYGVDDVEADMALLVHSYHASRDWLQLEVAAERGYWWYHNEPNLTAAVVTPVQVAEDQFAISAALDILHQGYGVVPYDGGTPSVHPQVLAGVLAHAAERVGAEAGAALAPDSPTPAGSVAQVFQEAKQNGLAITTLTPDSGDVSALMVSDVAKARINEALDAGYVVVIPERSVSLGDTEQVGWWQVDPATGRTFDRMENGMGFGPLGEDTVIIVGGPAWRAATAWKALSFVIGVIVGFSVMMAIRMYPN